MKFPKMLVLAAILIIIMIAGCNQEHSRIELTSVQAFGNQIKWEPLSEKMYFVNLSMRKIDSLSANLNLRFTKANIAGL